MFAKAIAHIGTEKTGTSSIQAFLKANRRKLLDRGYFYAESLGRKSQVRLAAFCQSDEILGHFQRNQGINSPEDVSRFRLTVQSDLEREIADIDRDVPTFLVSCEHLHSKLRSIDEIDRLKSFLDRYCSDVTILVYLRRQDQLAQSLSSTRHKSGRSGWDEVLPEIGDEPPRYYDYDLILSQYEEVFGRTRVQVALFERGAFKGDDLITDFCSRIGEPDISEYLSIEPRNESLSPLGLRYLAELNKHLAQMDASLVAPYRAYLVRALDAELAGRSVVLTRKEAMDFYAHFRAGNENVRSRYFPDRTGPLFNEDFSGYPEQRSEETFEFDDAVAVSAKLFERLLRRLAKAEAGLSTSQGYKRRKRSPDPVAEVSQDS